MKGNCHCGQIQFEVTGEPSWVGRCHCLDCQKISGSAYLAFAEFDVKDVIFNGNTPKRYKSSAGATRTFCDTCGSPIEWQRDDLPDKTSLTLGLFNDVTKFGGLDDLYSECRPGWDT